jgi:hypothetical protein
MSLNVNFHGSVLSTDHFRGLCMAPNGEVLAVPYSHTNSGGIIRIDPRVDPINFTKIPVASFSPITGEAWISASLAPNGKMLLSTWKQDKLLVVDTLDPAWPVSSISVGASLFWQQRSQCVGQDGNWWTVPYAASLVRTVNSATNAITNYSVSYQNHTHPNAGAIVDVDYNRPANFGSYCRYWGAVAGPTKLMFGMPFSAERVLVINPDAAGTPADPVAYEAGGPHGLVTGNNWNETFENQWYSPSGTLLFPTNNNSPAQKYSGGTYCPISRKIVAMPRRSPAVLVIDPFLAPSFGQDAPEGFIREIPLPKDNVQYNYNAEGGGNSNYFGSAHLADGRIMSVPWQNHHVVIWNGRTETVEFATIPELAPAVAAVNSGATTNFYTSGMLMPDGRTIFSPFNPTKFMTVDLGPGKTLTRDNLLQRWINRSL